MEQKLSCEDLWKDPSGAAQLLKKKENLQDCQDKILRFHTLFQANIDLYALAEEEGETLVQQEALTELKALAKDISRYRLELFFHQDEDARPCFLTVQAGSGGTEAQDWAAMLLRMYTRWAEQRNYLVELLDDSPGEEAGIRWATLKIKGNRFPYGWLKGETGVHRLVRISPFDASARRHTSFASITVIPDLEDTIDIVIQEKDLRIDTYRASGAGGQHVNKTDSAVRITHIPTGIVVQCQVDRSQHRNRAMAMSMLKARLHALEKQKQQEIEAAQRKDEAGITWGQQIRSYVLQPYQMVKDLRTQVQSGNPQAVLDGELDEFLLASLESNVQ